MDEEIEPYTQAEATALVERLGHDPHRVAEVRLTPDYVEVTYRALIKRGAPTHTEKENG